MRLQCASKQAFVSEHGIGDARVHRSSSASGEKALDTEISLT